MDILERIRKAFDVLKPRGNAGAETVSNELFRRNREVKPKPVVLRCASCGEEYQETCCKGWAYRSSPKDPRIRLMIAVGGDDIDIIPKERPLNIGAVRNLLIHKKVNPNFLYKYKTPLELPPPISFHASFTGIV
jgi:hypothetical protein